MTSVDSTDTRVLHVNNEPAPYSRAIRRAAGISLVLAGILNGLSQFLAFQLNGDLTFAENMRWGLDHPLLHRAEHITMVTSILFIPLGLLGIAQVTRWRAPRLTLVATPLMLWGMWGFHNILSMGYVSWVVGPLHLPIDQAIKLNDALPSEPGVVAIALVPHLAGSFLGVLLLTIAAWRSGAFSRIACALVVAFLVWDFLLPPVGPLEAHLLLAVAWSWMGVQLFRMSDLQWRGVATS